MQGSSRCSTTNLWAMTVCPYTTIRTLFKSWTLLAWGISVSLIGTHLMRLKFVDCKHETREMSGQESGENRRIPKSSPPTTLFSPTREPVQMLNGLCCMHSWVQVYKIICGTANRKQSRHLNTYQYGLRTSTLLFRPSQWMVFNQPKVHSFWNMI